MPVVKNFITAQKMKQENDIDLPELQNGLNIVDEKIAKNDQQSAIQGDKDNSSIVAQELAVREEEANRQAIEDQMKRDANIPVNEASELETLRSKYMFKVGDRPVKTDIAGIVKKERKGNQNIKLESGRIDALNDSIFFND